MAGPRILQPRFTARLFLLVAICLTPAIGIVALSASSWAARSQAAALGTSACGSAFSIYLPAILLDGPGAVPTIAATRVAPATVACTPASTPTATLTGTPSVTPTDSATNIPTNAPTGTVTVTSTGTPTDLPTVTPTKDRRG